MKEKIILCLILSVTLFINFTFAQEAGGGGEPSPLPSGGSGGVAANYTVEYNPEILEAFKNQTWLPVLVRLKDNSNITITGTKEERRNLSIQRDEWFKPVVEEFYTSLSKNDFRGEKSTTGFVGLINKKGFETLLNDSRVKSISWAKYGAQAVLENDSTSKNNNYTIQFEPEILETFKNQTWLHVFIILQDNSNIIVTGTKEERRNLSRQRDEWFKPVVDEVLATLSETEFNLSDKRSDGFSGYITKNGFNKLLQNTNVKKISQTSIREVHTTIQYESVSKNLSTLDKESTFEAKEPKSLTWLWIMIIILISIIVFLFNKKIKKR